jgi:hypothetical protein
MYREKCRLLFWAGRQTIPRTPKQKVKILTSVFISHPSFDEFEKAPFVY